MMPVHPEPKAIPHRWKWNVLYPLAARSADLVPVGRGGERRAISLGNPGLSGDPYTTPTLWAAIQYLAPREDAPEHRHTQSAFRFVLEGEGVWTVVDGDPVAMRRGDLLLTPGWAFHGHQNVSDAPMAWLDGLDIPLVAETDQGFFEFGPDQVRTTATPDRSASERLWGQPGLTPVALAGARPASPLVAYRWAHTDAALAAQLELEAAGNGPGNGQGLPGVLEPGHAAVRYTNPTSGGDALTTMRTEFHRLAAGAATRRSRTSASSVWQVFDGAGSVRLNDQEHPLERGDIIAVPAWTEFSLTAAGQRMLEGIRFLLCPEGQSIVRFLLCPEGQSIVRMPLGPSIPPPSESQPNRRCGLFDPAPGESDRDHQRKEYLVENSDAVWIQIGVCSSGNGDRPYPEKCKPDATFFIAHSVNPIPYNIHKYIFLHEVNTTLHLLDRVWSLVVRPSSSGELQCNSDAIPRALSGTCRTGDCRRACQASR